jgi:hypothetical protein
MKIKTVDLVYVIGNGSRWNDNELRLSLRSVTKNLSDIGKIFIVGHCPAFLKNVIYIPATDIYNPSINADGNMTHKLLIACDDKRLSDNFLFMNDDFIINQPLSVPSIEWMHKQDMASQPPEYWKTQFYRHRLKRTFDVLRERKMPTLQYDYHAPMLMNKNLFREVMANFDYASDIGYTFRSIYGNALKLPAISIKGRKITVFKFLQLAEIKSKSAGIKFVGYNDQGLNNSLKWWLIENFPNKSKYEIDLPEDRIFDVFFWVKRGMPYQEGVQIFKKYYKHQNLIKIFESHESEHLQIKLRYKLMQTINEL